MKNNFWITSCATKHFLGLCVHGNMDFETTFLLFVFDAPLLRHPLASVGYLDSRAVNCNHKIIIIVCLNATVEIGFQTVDSFAHVAITRMVWQGLSCSLDYPL